MESATSSCLTAIASPECSSVLLVLALVLLLVLVLLGVVVVLIVAFELSVEAEAATVQGLDKTS